MGNRYLPLYHTLKARVYPLTFVLSKDQQKRFNEHFAAIQTEYASLYGDDLIASVRRLGLIAFRVAMVLSVLRFVDNPDALSDQPSAQFPTVSSNRLACGEEDFKTALSLIDTWMQHTAAVYTNLLTPVESAETVVRLTDIQQRLFDALPKTFTRDEAITIAEQIEIPQRTADRILGQLVSKHHRLQRVKTGEYKKYQ